MDDYLLFGMGAKEVSAVYHWFGAVTMVDDKICADERDVSLLTYRTAPTRYESVG